MFGLIIIVGYYLSSRRRAGQFVLALSIIVGVALILPDASLEWATTGFHTEDTHGITAGRLDTIWRGMVGVGAFFWTAWAIFRRLAKNHADPLWRGVFEGGVVCLICLAVQGVTDDRFVPIYPQVALWLYYGLALGQAQSTFSTKRTQP